MKKVTLIDRYVAEVGRQLPEKNRADVQLELRSSLQDALDEGGIDPNNPAHEDKVVALLKEFGDPAKVAAGYGKRTFLIGPQLQAQYWLWLRWTTVCLAVYFVGRLVISAAFMSSGVGVMSSGVGEPNLGVVISEATNELIGNFLGAFAIITIIFGALEYFRPDLNLAKEEFDPRQLPEAALERDKVSLSDAVLELIFTGIFISVINLAPTWHWPHNLGAAQGIGNDVYTRVLPDLIAKFQPYIPWFTAIAVASVLLNIYLVMRRYWQPWARWADLALAVAFVLVTALTLQAAPFSSLQAVDRIVTLSIVITVIIAGITAAVKTYTLLKPRNPQPWAPLTGEK